MVGQGLSYLDRAFEDRSLRKRLDAIRRGNGKTLQTQPTVRKNSSPSVRDSRVAKLKHERIHCGKENVRCNIQNTNHISSHVKVRYEVSKSATGSLSSSSSNEDSLHSEDTDELHSGSPLSEFSNLTKTQSYQLFRNCTNLRSAPKRVKKVFHSSGRVLSSKEIQQVVTDQKVEANPRSSNCDASQQLHQSAPRNSRDKVTQRELQAGIVSSDILGCEKEELDDWLNAHPNSPQEQNNEWQSGSLLICSSCLNLPDTTRCCCHETNLDYNVQDEEQPLMVTYYRNLSRREAAGIVEEPLLLPWFA